MNPCAVAAHPLPANALLARYGADGGFADCYATTLPRPVSHAEFVEAFYTTRLFKLERWLLARMGYASTDDHARQLAASQRDRFAAWTVEGRCADQLLLCDAAGSTRSWLMVAPAEGGGTRLHFGSAVVARRRSALGGARMGFVFHALLGFHKAYSRALLSAARKRLEVVHHG
jgi:hypothetical protein